MIKFSCFNIIINEGKNKSIGYCLYNHRSRLSQVYFLFESVLQTIYSIRRQEEEAVALVFNRQGLTAKRKKYLLENTNSKGNVTRTERELIDLANAHCRLYKNRQHLLPIDNIKEAVAYFRFHGFKVHTLHFENWLSFIN